MMQATSTCVSTKLAYIMPVQIRSLVDSFSKKPLDTEIKHQAPWWTFDTSSNSMDSTQGNITGSCDAVLYQYKLIHYTDKLGPHHDKLERTTPKLVYVYHEIHHGGRRLSSDIIQLTTRETPTAALNNCMRMYICKTEESLN